MHRFLRSMLVVLMVSAAFAGCFGDDGDDDGTNPTPTPTDDGNQTNGNNNTTEDPFANAKRPPVPSMKITLEADGEKVEGPPFLVPFKSFVNVTFDASNSTDPDGEIRAISWDVSSKTGFSGTSSNETFTADFGEMKSTMFGVYKVVLKVLDDDNILNTTTVYIALDYQNTFALPGGMTGPGTDSRNDANEQKVSTLPGADVQTGTYELHQLTLAPNATAINLTLNYEGAGPQTTMALYLFDPNVTDTNSEEPAASADSGDSPVTLTHTGDLASGAWKVRAELDGVEIDSYTIDVVVTYTPPAPEQPDVSG